MGYIFWARQHIAAATTALRNALPSSQTILLLPTHKAFTVPGLMTLKPAEILANMLTVHRTHLSSENCRPIFGTGEKKRTMCLRCANICDLTFCRASFAPLPKK